MLVAWTHFVRILGLPKHWRAMPVVGRAQLPRLAHVHELLEALALHIRRTSLSTALTSCTQWRRCWAVKIKICLPGCWLKALTPPLGRRHMAAMQEGLQPRGSAPVHA